jgi:hypothetical protein
LDWYFTKYDYPPNSTIIENWCKIANVEKTTKDTFSYKAVHILHEKQFILGTNFAAHITTQINAVRAMVDLKLGIHSNIFS